MKKIAILLVSILFCTSVFANEPAKENFKLLNYKELKALIATGAKVNIYDANRDKTRGEQGIIPGAVLLNSPSEYDVAKVLPTDLAATLVFYCYNPKCTASHTAAEKASAAGYKNVNVFSDGIVGWVENGEKVTKPS